VISSDGANRRVLRCELGDYATFKFPPPVRRHHIRAQTSISSHADYSRNQAFAPAK
jgi:hypothetical protein